MKRGRLYDDLYICSSLSASSCSANKRSATKSHRHANLLVQVSFYTSLPYLNDTNQVLDNLVDSTATGVPNCKHFFFLNLCLF